MGEIYTLKFKQAISDELKLKVRNYCIIITCFWLATNIFVVK